MALSCACGVFTTVHDFEYSIVQVRDVSQLIKKAATSIGDHPQRFGTHSLRSGGASALFAAGTDNIAVKQFGRWKSDCPIRLTSSQTSTMASSMLNSKHTLVSINGQALQHHRASNANTSNLVLH
ncbi:hypothetical protein PHMEG_00027336 [Phytophthora megakarya]|uniref:Tyr recombinase domain-containing protein n=1 Tax=Phytophthora megakarya TaxID=4795 RepID=A0A225V7F4_9STRA|nr:hypothetical protein PHMEG_00027336 [Phytophthora megakarya]